MVLGKKLILFVSLLQIINKLSYTIDTLLEIHFNNKTVKQFVYKSKQCFIPYFHDYCDYQDDNNVFDSGDDEYLFESPKQSELDAMQTFSNF